MFLVRNKKTDEEVWVYGVVKDSHGYPHFVIYTGTEWRTVSAKHFVPV